MNKITYHRAGQNDIQTLADYRVIFSIELSGEQSTNAMDKLKVELKNYFTKAINDNTCISYIAKCDDKIAGIGSMVIREQPGHFKNPSGRWGYLMNMYTVPSFRRMGVCTGLLKCLVDDALQMGVTAFELQATKTGEFVYKQNGFEIHDSPIYRRYIS